MRFTKMRGVRRAMVLTALIVLAGRVAGAQTVTLTVAPEVIVPGTAATAIITGVPGQFFALLGSRTGSGAAYAGVNLAVGPDLVILALGNLDAAGQAVVTVVAPFLGTSLDRYYLQAATSVSPSFEVFEGSVGRILKNAESHRCAAGAAGPPGRLDRRAGRAVGRGFARDPAGATAGTGSDWSQPESRVRRG